MITKMATWRGVAGEDALERRQHTGTILVLDQAALKPVADDVETAEQVADSVRAMVGRSGS
jgi:hypothetical protein